MKTFTHPSRVCVFGKMVRIKDLEYITKGGEGEIYRIPQSLVPSKHKGRSVFLKLYKAPDHEDYNLTDPAKEEAMKIARKMAQIRLETHQTKLDSMMKLRTQEPVVNAIDLAWSDETQKVVVGYLMYEIEGPEPLLAYLDSDFRKINGITQEMIVDLTVQVVDIVAGLHAIGVTAGDINWLNLLCVVRRGKSLTVYLVDLDSMQWGPYRSRAYTQLLVDPQLCDPAAPVPTLHMHKEYAPENDWYIVRILVMKLLTGVTPYEGLYRPKNGQKVAPIGRPMKGLTFLDTKLQREFEYPKAAVPLTNFPNAVVADWIDCFVHGKRVPVDRNLLLSIVGKAVSVATAPVQIPVIPVAKPSATAGTVNMKQIFTTRNPLVHFRVDGKGNLQWLEYIDRTQVKRETGQVITIPEGEVITSEMTFGTGLHTYIGIGRLNQIFVLHGNGRTESVAADSTQSGRINFAANDSVLLFTQGGFVKSKEAVHQHIYGAAIARRTHLWTSNRMTFGYYSERAFNRCLILDPTQRGLHSDTAIPPVIDGQLVRMTCEISDTQRSKSNVSTLAWLLYNVKERTGGMNYCVVYDSLGNTVAQGQSEDGSDTWLSGFMQGKSAAIGNSLFVPTDDGLVRIDPENGQLKVSAAFPQTQSAINAQSRLYISQLHGIVAVNGSEVTAVSM